MSPEKAHAQESSISQDFDASKMPGVMPPAMQLKDSTQNELPVTLLSKAKAILDRDAKTFSPGKFPAEYYIHFSKELAEFAQENGKSPKQAFRILRKFISSDEFNSLGKKYQSLVQPDETGGLDKVKHFLTNASYTRQFGGLFSKAASIGKESLDEVKQWVGKHPTGWDSNDMDANNKGIQYGREAINAERQQKKQKNKATIDTYQDIFVDGDLESSLWFIQNFP